MTFIFQCGEWCAAYRGHLGWGASLTEAGRDCWAQYLKYGNQ